ncbi:MAG TPA: Rieske 2Fe-2S domain-containing protein [Dehalococcoidia bacterium]|nr:Rieske 2Fe-2S domain-containing protein [Dehalococcoidia bacterium]
MLTSTQNDTLTHVGPKTPVGNLMRRFWVPALLSWELAEPDCPPLEIRVLGEDLVAFRATDGTVGLVERYCAHRRASLFWGRNEENGLRCVYHGWKFDASGACVEMASEPADSNFKDRVRIQAYPTYEVGGVVWAYMGPADHRPPLPHFPWTQVPPQRRALSKVWQECNWLQCLEGGIDTVHVNFLHGGRPPGQRYDDRDARGRANNVSTAARLEVMPTDYGFVYAGIRDMGAEGTNHVRLYHWVMPWNQIRQTGSGPYFSGHMWVPMDDENTMVYNWDYLPIDREDTSSNRHVGKGGDAPIWFRDAELEIGAGNGFGSDVDVVHGFRSIQNRSNRYEIDRQVQKTKTYTGIPGINVQDRAVQESMGRIAERSLERLGTTDRAIIAARRSLLNAIEDMEAGKDPPGVSASYYNLRPGEIVIPKDTSWLEAAQPLLREITPVSS